MSKRDVVYSASEWSRGGQVHVRTGQQNTIIDMLAGFSQYLESNGTAFWYRGYGFGTEDMAIIRKHY